MMALSAMAVLGVPMVAGAVCPDWKRAPKFADVEAASVVFEGVVERIEPGDTSTCSPDRVIFRVERSWKGVSTEHYSLLQANGGRVNERQPNGAMANRGCLMSAESDRFTTVGDRYIVFASGPLERLGAMGCGTSRAPTGRERKRLDKWLSSQTAKRK